MNSEILEILTRARSAGISLFCEGEVLRLKIAKDLEIDPSLLEEIKKNKQAISSFLKSNSPLEAQLLPKIEKSEHGWRDIPASFSQERLWLTDQIQGTVQYHIPTLVKLTGTVHMEALRAAFRNVVSRHEILRTVLQEENGSVFQRPYQGPEFDLMMVKEFSNSYADYIDFENGKPFDLSKDLMIRAQILSISPGEYLLHIVMHHIVADGWSMVLFVREIIESYKAAIENRATLLEPLKIQYSDYALWQRKSLTGSSLENRLAYWRKKLDGISPLFLPGDYVRPVRQSFSGHTIELQLDACFSKRLNDFSIFHGVTLFVTLLSCFKVLLYRYTGQTDICVGTSVANREQEEVEPLIGFFVNSIVLRSSLVGSSTFESLLLQVKSMVLEAFQHQELPFEKIVELTESKRDLGRTPVFQVQFSMNNNPPISLEKLVDMTIEELPSPRRTSQFDLTFNIEVAEQLKVNIEYSTDLFCEARIRRMAGHYRTLLESIISSPSKALSDLEILTHQERQDVQIRFNKTFGSLPQRTVVQYFEEHCNSVPDKIAIYYDQHCITFEELNNRANQLARVLRERLISDQFIPVCFGRSIEMIIALFGILKSGNAFVPIDRNAPKKRIISILDELDSKILVTTPHDDPGVSGWKWRLSTWIDF